MGFVRTADVVFVVSDSDVLIMSVTLDHEDATRNISGSHKIIKSRLGG
jgi:hypothetical protein